MDRLLSITLSPAAAAATAVAASQTPGGAGNLTLNGTLVTGGVATFDTPRRVLLTTAADETGKTFTFVGTDRAGRVITEAMTGPSTTTKSTVNDFLTVTQVSVSAGTAGAVTVGTGGVVSSQWVPVDRNKMANLGFGVKAIGTVSYTVEHTFDDPFTPGVGVQPPGGMPAFAMTPYPHPSIAAKTDNQSGWYTGQPITAVRLTINSYSAGGGATINFAPGFLEGN